MPPLLATLKHFNWKRVAIVYQKTDRWIKINDYVSKILKLPNNNITIGIEHSVEYLPRKLFTMDFEHLRVSVAKIKQKARSKCFDALLFPSCVLFSFFSFFIPRFLSFFSFFLLLLCSFFIPAFISFHLLRLFFIHQFLLPFLFRFSSLSIVSLFLPFLSFYFLFFLLFFPYPFIPMVIFGVGGGGTYSYIRVLNSLFLLTSIVLIVCGHQYVNMCPLPQRTSLLRSLHLFLRRFLLNLTLKKCSAIKYFGIKLRRIY